MKTWLAALACVVGFAGAVPAFAHGGEYSAPPLYKPKGDKPLGHDDTPPGDPPGAITPSDPAAPPSITAGGSDPKLGADDWRRWWTTDRRLLLRSRADVALTASSGPTRLDTAQEALLRALGDDDEDVATAAIVSLGKRGDLVAEPKLVEILADRTRKQPVREAAACALALLPRNPTSDRARAALESVVVTRELPARLRSMAAYALGLRGDTASLEVLAGLSHVANGDVQVAAAATASLGFLATPEAISELRRVLVRGPDGIEDGWLVRVHAAQGLALARDAASIPDLKRALDDAEPAVRRAAALALAELADANDESVHAALRKRIDQDNDVTCRDVAVIAIGRQGSPKARPVLEDAFRGGRNVHRTYAAVALGLWARRNAGSQSTAALRASLASTTDAPLRGVVCVALALARDREAAAVVLRIAEGAGETDVRALAAAALSEIGTRDETAPALRRLLGADQPPQVRREAAATLGVLGDAGAAAQLQDVLDHADSLYLRAAAVVALGRVGGPGSSEKLVATLGDTTNPGILRAMAAVGLGILGDRPRERPLHAVGTAFDWGSTTDAVSEMLSIL